MASPPDEASRRRSLPSAVITIWSALCTVPSRLTPTPFSVATRVMRLAYMPPRAEESMATWGLGLAGSSASGGTVPSVAMLFLPATTVTFLPRTWASTEAVRASRVKASVLSALMPAPSMLISPRCTSCPVNAPAGFTCGTPVLSVARGTLMKPPPLTVMPLGFARITSAGRPPTSM